MTNCGISTRWRRTGSHWRRLATLVLVCTGSAVILLYTAKWDSSDIAMATLRDGSRRGEAARYRLRQPSDEENEMNGARLVSAWQRAAEQYQQQQQQQQSTKSSPGDVRFYRQIDGRMKDSDNSRAPASGSHQTVGSADQELLIRREGEDSQDTHADAVKYITYRPRQDGDRRVQDRDDNSASEAQLSERRRSGPAADAAADEDDDDGGGGGGGDSMSSMTSSSLVGAALRGGPGNCRLHDVRRPLPSDADFAASDCVRLQPTMLSTAAAISEDHLSPPSSPPPTTINGTESSHQGRRRLRPLLVCPHPDDVDVHLSKPLRTYGVWEPHIVRLVMAAMSSRSAVTSSSSSSHRGGGGGLVGGFYDIGANVGQYSVLAAGVYGRRVIAVEPFRPNIDRLHKAVTLNRLEDKVIIVENAVSDVRDTFELSVVNGNPSGIALTSQDADRYCNEPECPAHATTILMDDLLEVTNFDTAVMKIDVEGYEHRAFVHSDQLLSEIHVSHIFMEWTRMRDYYGAETDDTENKRLVQRLVDRLGTGGLGYTAYGVNEGQRLDVRYWYGWPHDVVWVHRDAATPRDLLNIN